MDNTTLEERIEFMTGQIEATMELLALVIASLPRREAFVEGALPEFAQSLEEKQRGRNSQAFLDGLKSVPKALLEKFPYWMPR